MKNKLFAFGSILSRMISNFGVVVVAARYLHVDDFVQFAAALSWSAIVIVLTDAGTSTYLFKEGNSKREQLKYITSYAAKNRFYSSIAVILLGAIAGVFFDLKIFKTGFNLIILSSIIGGMADLYYISVRIKFGFLKESVDAIFTSLLHFSVCLFSLYYFGSIEYLAAAYILSRSVYLMIGYLRATNIISEKRDFEIHKVKWLTWFMLFLDTVLTNALMQIDVLVAPHVMSQRELPIYMAGSRILLLVAPVAFSIASTRIGRLTEAVDSGGNTLVKSIAVVTAEYFVAGIVLASLVYIFGSIIVMYGYGIKYAELNEHWCEFSLLIFFRIMLSGIGLILIVLNKTMTRVFMNSSSLIIFIFLIYIQNEIGVYEMALTAVAALISSIVISFASVINTLKKFNHE
jgi:O-antigen/teichoic acid export membrane protein